METVLPIPRLATVGGNIASGAHVRVLASWADFDLIRPQWDELHRRVGGGLFSSGGWLAAWRAQQSALGAAIQELRIVTIWRDGFIVAAAPVGIGPVAPSKYLPGFRPIAVRMLGEVAAGHTEWLVQSREDADALAGEVVRLSGNGWLHLDPIRASGVAGDAAGLLANHFGPLRSFEHFKCTTLDLRGGFEAYMDARPRAFRKLARVAERRAAEARCARLTERDRGEAILDGVIEISRRAWKGQAGTGIGVSEANRVYLRALWREFSPTNDFHVHMLLIGGREAAHAITIDCNGVAYGLICDFDEDYAHCSPGRLVILDAIRDAAARGIGCYDMLRRTHYLEQFSDDFYRTSRVVAFPRRNAAWLAFSAEAAARRLLGGLKLDKRKRARRIDFVGSADEGGEA